MDLTFGVGSVITIFEFTDRIRRRFIDAPNQFRAISQEITNLSTALTAIKDVNDVLGLTEQQKTDLQTIAEACELVLKEVEKILDKNQEFEPAPTGFKTKTRRIWKRLLWEQKEINYLRDRVISSVSLLNLFVDSTAAQKSANASATIQKGVEKLQTDIDKLQIRQKTTDESSARTELLDWLSPQDYSLQQNDFFLRRQEGTGQWLLDSDAFQKWFSKGNQTLFCPGMPGAGKTIMASIVVNHLEDKFESDERYGIAYLYCNFRRPDEQYSVDLLANILKQLLRSARAIPQKVEETRARHGRKTTRPSLRDLLELLQVVITECFTARTFLIIDAVDELQDLNGNRTQFLADLCRLQAATGLSLFLTSRDQSEILDQFQMSIQQEIRADKNDVNRYIRDHMALLPKFVVESPELQEEIRNTIGETADGMFLLVQLNFEFLRDKTTRKKLKTALQQLPRASKPLASAYDNAMARIQGQSEESSQLAKQVLGWITCAKRPLTTKELQHGLAVEIGETEFDEDNLPELQRMVSVCAGLVTIDRESDVVRLVHYTTQEYFEKTRLTWFPDAEEEIVYSCLTYLSYPVFHDACKSQERWENWGGWNSVSDRLRDYPLYDYAARNWGLYETPKHEIGQTLLHEFLSCGPKVSSSFQAIMYAKERGTRDYAYDHSSEFTFSGLHLATWFGLPEVILASLKCGIEIDSLDFMGNTSLMLAVMKGHVTVLQILIASGADVNIVNPHTRYCTALHRAAGQHHFSEVESKAMLRVLLDANADPHQSNRNGETPLHYAVSENHEFAVEMLLHAGADPNQQDKHDDIALHHAVGWVTQSVMQLLLDMNADIFHENRKGKTPLDLAILLGERESFEMLLKGYTRLSQQDKYAKTVARRSLPEDLVSADQFEDELVFSTVRDRRNNQIQQALFLAIVMNQVSFVEDLLAAGAGIGLHDENGDTPLLVAVQWAGPSIVHSLLGHGANIHHRNTRNETVLDLAFERLHKSIQELLLTTLINDLMTENISIEPQKIIAAIIAIVHESNNELLSFADEFSDRKIDLSLIVDGVNKSQRSTRILQAAGATQSESLTCLSPSQQFRSVVGICSGAQISMCRIATSCHTDTPIITLVDRDGTESLEISIRIPGELETDRHESLVVQSSIELDPDETDVGGPRRQLLLERALKNDYNTFASLLGGFRPEELESDDLTDIRKAELADYRKVWRIGREQRWQEYVEGLEALDQQ